MTQLSSFLQSAFSMWKTTSALFWGPYCFVYLFFLSLITVLVLDKQSERKMTYAGYSLLVLFALYNPIVFYLCRKVFGESTAYFSRLYSLLPVPYMIAYSAVLIFHKKKQVIRLLLFLCLEAVIILGGKNVYSEDWIAPGENPTKLSDEVLQVCDIVHGYKEHVCIAVPQDLATYIRQYDGAIIMPYGRDMYYNEMREAMKPDVPDIDQILAMAGEKACDFLVVKKNADNYRHFEEHNQLLYGETENHLVYLLQNIPRIERQYNDFFQITEERNLAADGQPILNASNYAIAKYKYDSDGNRCMSLYYDTNESPICTSMGYYGISQKYDKRHLVQEEIYLNQNAQPYIASFGYASAQYEYDEKNRRNKELYFDESGIPIMLSSGQYGLRRKYNSNNQISQTTYLDAEENPVMLKAGYATVEREYDIDGNLITEYYFDVNFSPIALAEGQYGYKKEYNDKKQLLQITYVNAAHNSMLISSGYSSIKYKYDSSGNPIEEYYYDTDDNPIALPTGEYGCRKYFNSKKQINRIMFIDAEGKPIKRNAGYGGFECNFNNHNQIIAMYYLDTDGNPIALPSGQYGFHRTFNEKGLIQTLTFVNKNHDPMEIGEPKVSTIEYQYDDDLHLKNTIYYNLYGDIVRKEES